MNRMWAAATVVIAMLASQAGAGDSLADWELEFGGEVLKAAVGKECSYYVLHVPNSSRNAPGLKDALAMANTHGGGTDWRLALVCVNHADGKIRWSRVLGNYTRAAANFRDRGEFGIYVGNAHLIFDLFKPAQSWVGSLVEHWRRRRLSGGLPVGVTHRA